MPLPFVGDANEPLRPGLETDQVLNLFQGFDGKKARFHPDDVVMNGEHMKYDQAWRYVLQLVAKAMGLSLDAVTWDRMKFRN